MENRSLMEVDSDQPKKISRASLVEQYQCNMGPSMNLSNFYHEILLYLYCYIITEIQPSCIGHHEAT